MAITRNISAEGLALEGASGLSVAPVSLLDLDLLLLLSRP